MNIAPGKRLGPYEILSLIGASDGHSSPRPFATRLWLFPSRFFDRDNVQRIDLRNGFVPADDEDLAWRNGHEIRMDHSNPCAVAQPKYERVGIAVEPLADEFAVH